jgi:hypothetical protein
LREIKIGPPRLEEDTKKSVRSIFLGVLVSWCLGGDLLFGSSRISGGSRTDLEEEAGLIPEGIGDSLEDLDLVVRQFQGA